MNSFQKLEALMSRKKNDLLCTIELWENINNSLKKTKTINTAVSVQEKENTFVISHKDKDYIVAINYVSLDSVEFICLSKIPEKFIIFDIILPVPF